MRQFLVRFIRPESFAHTQSSAGFTIATSEFKFFGIHTSLPRKTIALMRRREQLVYRRHSIVFVAAERLAGEVTADIKAHRLLSNRALKEIPVIEPTMPPIKRTQREEPVEIEHRVPFDI
jgi:hypothetical protein